MASELSKRKTKWVDFPKHIFLWNTPLPVCVQKLMLYRNLVREGNDPTETQNGHLQISHDATKLIIVCFYVKKDLLYS
jgi:hypothetical protein